MRTILAILACLLVNAYSQKQDVSRQLGWLSIDLQPLANQI
jgi:hypothetical protein